MIPVTRSLSIHEDEIHFDFIRASGPGGQNVNKVATAAQLRFDVKNSRSLPPGVRARLARSAGRRLTGEGVLVIEARRFRTQQKNRADALERLKDLVRKAATPPRERKKTRPSQASKERRLKQKRIAGDKKRMRSPVGEDE
ncbi:MAG: aminoacyl-tRNA hydrolase [Chitinivibrionales bacterium]|nr:aminoacyl-tRNA hydrolase [Chitinivibrionales bacterium]MBD3396686.1 aminoacyl-tRNA hydrolase [Chitinivibrionales bacterium]